MSHDCLKANGHALALEELPLSDAKCRARNANGWDINVPSLWIVSCMHCNSVLLCFVQMSTKGRSSVLLFVLGWWLGGKNVNPRP